MKVNNPLVDVFKPITIKDENHYNHVIKILDGMGYMLGNNNSLFTLGFYDSIAPKNYLYCYSDKTVYWDDELNEHDYYNLEEVEEQV